jgi:hypothetical protein
MTHHAKEREDRPCVNGWSGCSVCAFEIECRMGRYTGESAIEKAAAIAEEIVHKEAVESVKVIKGCKAYTNLDRFYAWKSPSLNYKEAVLVGGPPAKGGGGKTKGKKSKKGTKVIVEAWTSNV